MNKHYRVTDDSNDETFVMNRKESGLPNMKFQMHASGIHAYQPNESNKSKITFINTVSENTKAFNKRETKRETMAKQLYSNMLYPSNADFRWIIQNNNIKNCDIMVRDIDAEWEIWGKDIYALKGKATRTKTNPAARDIINILKQLIKIKNKMFLAVDLFV